jgi:hypothetical protein
MDTPAYGELTRLAFKGLLAENIFRVLLCGNKKLS